MKQPVALTRLIGSAFTSVAVRDGWRHFHVLSWRRGTNGVEVELAASCDSARRAWVALSELRDRTKFSPGWASLAADH